MKVLKLLVGIAFVLAVAAAVSVAGDRGDKIIHELNQPPPPPWAGFGAYLYGTVISSTMDAQSPMGWAIYRDEHGNYWKIRFQECDRVAGFSCPREVLWATPIKR